MSATLFVEFLLKGNIVNEYYKLFYLLLNIVIGFKFLENNTKYIFMIEKFVWLFGFKK